MCPVARGGCKRGHEEKENENKEEENNKGKTNSSRLIDPYEAVCYKVHNLIKSERRRIG